MLVRSLLYPEVGVRVDAQVLGAADDGGEAADVDHSITATY
jgi:hypothetical protein